MELHDPIRRGLGQDPNGGTLTTIREHNGYVYKQVIGVSDAEYQELAKKGHIGTDYIPKIM